MRVEIYVRPIEVPHTNFEESDVRIYYNGQWVGFRKGEVTITKDESAKEQAIQAGRAEAMPVCKCVGNFKNGCLLHGGGWKISPAP